MKALQISTVFRRWRCEGQLLGRDGHGIGRPERQHKRGEDGEHLIELGVEHSAARNSS